MTHLIPNSSSTTLPDDMDTEQRERRQLLKLSMYGLAAFAPTAKAFAQATTPTATTAPSPTTPPERPEPVIDARFPSEVAPGVFVIPDKRIPLVPNVGIVVGRELALVVDCGLGLESAANVLAAVRQVAPGRRIVLTATHAHPEHGFGAHVFQAQGRIYYNRAQRDYLARAGNSLLAGFRSIILPPNHRHVLDGVVLVPPDQTYDGATATLDLGGREVVFRTWGTAHSPGDQVVFLPEERIVFAGDLVEERIFPIVPLFPPMITISDIDVTQWELALADIRRLEPRLVIPGHGNLGGPEIVREVADYLARLRTLVATAGDRTALEAQIRARHPTWERSEFIAPAVAYFQSVGRGAPRS